MIKKYEIIRDYFSEDIRNPKSIRLFRICLYSIILFQTLILCLPVADWIWGSNSFIRPVILEGSSYDKSLVYKFFMILNDGQWENWYPLLLTLQCVALLAGILGKFNRVSAIIVYVTTVLLFNRSYLLLTGGNYLIHLFLFFLLFVNEKGRESGWNAILTNCFYLACQFQVLTVYFFSSIFKISGAKWQSGEALHYLFNMQEFSLPFVIGNLNGLSYLVLISSYLSVAYQFLFPILVWNKRLKKPLLLFGILFHILIIFLMGIPVFGMIMIASYLLFLNDNEIDSLCNFFRVKKKKLSFNDH